MTNEFYKKLIEVYVGGDLGTSVSKDLKQVVDGNEDLKQDLVEMQAAYNALRDLPTPEFTEESYQRILMKVYTRGGELQTRTPVPSHLQYHLPLHG